MTNHFREPGGRILIVGCGLIGTSFAKAIREKTPNAVIHGVEANPRYREVLANRDVFQEVYDVIPTPPDGHTSDEFLYDWGILAVPVTTACELMVPTSRVARYVADVCSVKEPICEKASDAGLRGRFVPSHPMAGLATSGPESADGALFRDRPWILVEGWPAADVFEYFIALCEARVTTMPTARLHDDVMASVSHGIHLMSIGAMLATKSMCGDDTYSGVTGPGFRDVTRLAGSPEGFWVDTLLKNAGPVSEYLRNASSILTELVSAIEQGDKTRLAQILISAREAKAEWS